VIFLIVVPVILVIIGGIHLYLWKRLVRDTLPRGRARRLAGFGVLVLALLIPLSLIGERLVPQGARPLLAWPGYVWLGLMFYLLVTLALLEVPRLVLRLALRTKAAAPAPVPALVGAGADPLADPVPDPVPDPSRRLLLGRSLAAVAGAASVAATGIGMVQALGAPDLKRVRIPLAKLPASMDGFRIALVSDIHLGPLLGRSHTERIVRMINSADADAVAIVGDLVDGSVAELGSAAEPLQDLRARLGSFFVTGNHEYFSGYEEWIDEVRGFGLRVLRNERVTLDGLDLAGVNDATGGQYQDGPDYAAALDGRDAGRPVVLLAHQPVQAHEAARHGVDLQLSGHTHGGQMVPFNLIVGLQQPITAGLGEIDGTKVYVTRGAGFWGPPVRFGAPPDISIVELHAP
jgi:predicted MPP superfamily phosphohydrolase